MENDDIQIRNKVQNFHAGAIFFTEGKGFENMPSEISLGGTKDDSFFGPMVDIPLKKNIERTYMSEQEIQRQKESDDAGSKGNTKCCGETGYCGIF